MINESKMKINSYLFNIKIINEKNHIVTENECGSNFEGLLLSKGIHKQKMNKDIKINIYK